MSRKRQRQQKNSHAPKSSFEFKDRSGKTHGRHKREHEAEAAPQQREKRPRPGAHVERPQRSRRPSGRPQGRLVGRVMKATVDKNHKGFAFLIYEEKGHEDVFVPARDATALFHGDRVELTLDHDGDVVGLKVLEHRFRELVGRFAPHPMGPARGGWVVYERKKAREEIFIPKLHQTQLNPNDWVRAKLQFHESGPFPVTAEITEVYGATLPASADIGMVAAEFNLLEDHSKAAEHEARTFELGDFSDRVDLRDLPLITIDGETARDFDDAVYVERQKSGHVLWVGIADVSHYVREGTALDKDARSRGTSVYFPERAFHMLPKALSENLCSLKPKVPRMAMVARMEYNFKGERTRTEVMEAVIESKRRATYNEIQSEWEQNKSNSKWEFAPHFELYGIIRKTRSERGSIDFDLPEADVRVDEHGEVLSIDNRTRLDAHRLIEEFMIAANEAVTEWMMERKWPFVYRVHDVPAAQALQKFSDLAATVGIHFSVEDAESPQVLADVVRRLEGHPAQTLLNIALLRSMKQAVYSATHGIHYGLASEGYTHFTSPIRRYPDLVVHRLLRWALQVERREKHALGGSARNRLEEQLAEICDHCSYRERLAADAERESIKLKQVRLMRRHLGDEFEGRIIGMIESGFFVQLDNPYVEGMVTKESMADDFYVFNEDRMIFYGTRKKRTFKIGDRVKVRVVRADIDRRQIDFALA